MIRSFSECGPPIDDADVRAVEQEIGLSLPKNYRSFLLAHNGGRPEPNAFPIIGFENNPFGAIQLFLGINDDIMSSNLNWNFETMNGRLPDNLLAIACTGSGDLICLSLYGDDAGAIVFWDFYNEPPEPSYDNVYHIADSFEVFLDSIQELPD
jgi:hypothetical protein